MNSFNNEFIQHSNAIDIQTSSLQEALSISYKLKELFRTLENEKKEAQEKCVQLQEQIKNLQNKECLNCNVLLNKLKKEREERGRLKKEEKSKLLKTIAKTLAQYDEGNTNQMTNPHQFLTQLVCGSLVESSERNETQVKGNATLVEDSDSSDEESNSRVLVNETVIEVESESSSDCHNKFPHPITVPETEAVNYSSVYPSRNGKNLSTKNINGLCGKRDNDCDLDDQPLSYSKEELEVQPQLKKRKSSPILSTTLTNVKIEEKLPSIHVETSSNDVTLRNMSAQSPSVLSEVMDSIEATSSLRENGADHAKEGKEIVWKMKASAALNNKTDAPAGKKLKQMTLSLSRPQKKHDISLSQGFKGGVANNRGNQCDEEKDVVLPSPERYSKKPCSNRKKWSCGSLEDPDLTLFQPPVTSTCLPVNTSFDRLPEQTKSPPYKYRRDALHKKEERAKLPGQDCDHCTKYYKASGLDSTQEIRARMNTCSRHRDKYQLRANTPPGFWDPVLPASPDET